MDLTVKELLYAENIFGNAVEKSPHPFFFVLLFGCFLFVLSIIVCTQHGAHSECIVHALSIKRLFFHAHIVHFFCSIYIRENKASSKNGEYKWR